MPQAHHRQPSTMEIAMIRRLAVLRRLIDLVAAGVAFELCYRNGEWVIVEVTTDG